VTEDYLTLFEGTPEVEAALAERDVDAVLWRRNEPLSTILAGSPRWRVVYVDDAWTVVCRRAAVGERCRAERS
jgi:hypothetical protein